MPKNIFIFVRQVLIFSLPNNSNLCRWGNIEFASCILCTSNKQTQLHILCNCPVSVTEGRYTWRHDSILYTLLQYLCQLKNYGFNIYCDKIFIEITSLDLVTTHIENLNSILKETVFMEGAMRASFYIYIRRNKLWTYLPLLKFIS